MERREALVRYQLLARHTRDIILFLRSSDAHILEANDAAVKAYGYTRNELLSMTSRQLRDPDKLATFGEELNAAAEGGVFFETRHRRKDGSTFPVEVAAQGAAIGGERIVLSVIRDISERKRADRERDRFFDLSIDMMCVANFDGYFLRLNPAWKSTLGFSTEELCGTPFMVEGQGSTFWFTARFDKRVQLEVEVKPTPLRGRRALIVGDDETTRDALHQYMVAWGMRSGLASNAAEAIEMLREAAEARDPYHVAIIDFVMPLMDGFELARAIRNDPALASTQLILVTAFDAKDRGKEALRAGFNAYLTKPLRQSQLFDCLTGVVDGETQQLLRNAGAKTETHSPRENGDLPTQSQHEVLVAEDNTINQQLVVAQLQRLGIRPDLASNGREAFKAFQKHQYALILMDCQMPEMDGFEVTRLIRKAEHRTGRHVSIIALTANAMDGDREACIAVGMDDYLSKPVDLKRLQETIERWLLRIDQKRAAK